MTASPSPSFLYRFSLRAQLAAFIGAALLPGFALLFWIRGEARMADRDRVNSEATQLAQLVAETQTSRTSGVEQLLATISTMQVVRDADPTACSARLAAVRRLSSAGYLNFGMADLTGRVLCTAVGSPGVSIADNPAFKEASLTGALAMSPTARGRMTGRPVFVYNRKIRFETGTERMFFVGFSLDTMATSLARVPLPPNASLGLIERGGLVITANPRGAEASIQRAATMFGKSGVGSDSTITLTDDRGITRTFAKVLVGAPDNLIAIAALPVDSRNADASTMTAMAIFGASSLAMIAAALFLAGITTRRPLRALVHAAERVRDGDFSVRAGLTSVSPDLRALSDGFDAMTSQLQQREQSTRQTQRLEAFGQLAGGVAHDFNNLLTVIIGYSEELRTQVTPAGRIDLEEVLSAGKRAKDLTQQLLAFGRQQVLKTEPVQINRVVTDLARMLQRVIGEQISLDLALQPALPIIRGDRTQLEQVITNLVVNARDAMPHGGSVTIATDTLRVAADEASGTGDVPPGHYARLSVTDTGVGMNAETVSHLFEPFFTTKEMGHGTGLGLATVYGIVRQSGGYLTVNSVPGQGTRFDICFPASHGKADDTGPVAASAPTKAAATTILVVEDEPMVRRLTVSVLRRAGYTVLEAANARDAEAVAYTPGASINLLLTDVILGSGPTGVSLGRTLKAALPALIVLHMSGYSTELSSAATTSAERAAFLAKPFTTAQLLDAVHNALAPQVERAK